ncbi:hypothetical protein [Microcystis aeruginosa]|uniref:hypothetical protein n=1 Tax=Microcystis aeruginosa TaxID=1126 RepID=UPI001E319F70|nr:hypothetical protein [Microcystis aeruginosa]
MNTTTTFKSLSGIGVVFAGTVGAIARLTALPVRYRPLKPFRIFLVQQSAWPLLSLSGQ